MGKEEPPFSSLRVWNKLLTGPALELWREIEDAYLYGHTDAPVEVQLNLAVANFNAVPDDLAVLTKEDALMALVRYVPELSRLMQSGLNLERIPGKFGQPVNSMGPCHLWAGEEPYTMALYYSNFCSRGGVETFTIDESYLLGRHSSLLGKLGARATKCFSRGEIIGIPGGEVFLKGSPDLPQTPEGLASQYKLEAVKPDGTKVILFLDPTKGYGSGDNAWNILLRRVNDPSIDLGGKKHMRGAFQMNSMFWVLIVGGFPHLVLMATRDIYVGQEITACYGKAYNNGGAGAVGAAKGGEAAAE